MSNGSEPTDPRWPRLLSLAVHEFRTPVTVVAGYIRMLLKDKAGPLTEQQRRLLEEADKSCGRLSTLIAEMSDLAGLEGGTASLNRGHVDIGALVAEIIESLPPLPDREMTVTLQNQAQGATVRADGNRLRTAIRAILLALRRELVTTPELCVRLRRDGSNGDEALRISMADNEHLEAVDALQNAGLGVFDEWRGGCGLSLAVARRIVGAHGGRVWSPLENSKAGAVIVIPAA